MGLTKKAKGRAVRKVRIRKKIEGTSERPRLSIYRSSRYFYAQIIDDTEGKTLAACSSIEKNFKGKLKSGASKEAATEVGKELASRAKAKKIDNVIFDRNGFSFTGRITVFADAAREAGLKF